MATQILAAGSAAANSTTFSLVEGQELTLSIFPATGNTLDPSMKPLVLAKQASTTNWTRQRVLLGFDAPVQIIRGAGDYRLERPDQPAGVSVGADKG